jgi:hypothetical protein
MKRSEAVKLIHNIISDELLTTEEFNLNDCSELLKALEEEGMFYCPEQDCGEFQLRTPKGWEREDE